MPSATREARSTNPALGVYRHTSGQFVARVGFDLHPRTGKRIRGFQYLGRDPLDASRKNADIVELWQWSKRIWNTPMSLDDDGKPITLGQFLRLGLPDPIRDVAELELPVMAKREWMEAAAASSLAQADLHALAMARAVQKGAEKRLSLLDETKAALTRMQTAAEGLDAAKLLPPALQARLWAATQPSAIEAAGFAPTARNVTLDEASKLYLEDERSRVGLAEDGIKLSSFQEKERAIRLALEIQLDGEVVLPAAMPMQELTREKLIVFKRAWLGRVTREEVSKRTVANYVKAVQYMLAWCYKRDSIVTRRIADLEDIFRFTDVNPINIADYDADLLKAILGNANDRVRLFVLLMLNTGLYASDIGAMKVQEIRKEGSDWYIERGREKENNCLKGCWWLWPETRRLLQSCMADENEGGFVLLNRNGKPLHRLNEKGVRRDDIAKAYDDVLVSINKTLEQPIGLPLKQLRKIGATAMERIGGTEVQKVYRCTAMAGADKFYIKRDFSPLTAALKQWRKELVKDGIMAAIAKPTA